MPKIPGYHYAATEDGVCAIEADTPAEGMTTVTWKPASSFFGEPVEFVIPTIIFQECTLSYLKEATLAREAASGARIARARASAASAQGE